MFEKVKLAFIAILAAISVWFFYFLSDPIYKMISLFGGGLLAVVLFFTATIYGHQFFVFLKDVKIELLKVFWPDKNDLLRTTISVFFLVFLFAVLLWLMDLFFSWFVSKLLI